MARILGLLKALATHERPARYCLARMLKELRLSSFLLIRQKDFALRFYPTSLSSDLWIDPAACSRDEILFRRYLRPGDTVIDVGANIGQLSLVASVTVGETGKVIAIEPHPGIYRCLCGNIVLNRAKNIDAHNYAIGERDGRALFSTGRSDDTTNAIASNGGINVPIRRLDSLSREIDSIALLKVDVEGYEKFVFEGGPVTLARTECIYFESWDVHFAKFGYSFSDVARCLRESGFQLYRPMGEELFGPIEGVYRSTQCENLLALRITDEFLVRTGFRLRGWQESGSEPPSGEGRI